MFISMILCGVCHGIFVWPFEKFFAELLHVCLFVMFMCPFICFNVMSLICLYGSLFGLV